MHHQNKACCTIIHHRTEARPTLLSAALAIAVCAPTFAFAQDIAGGGGIYSGYNTSNRGTFQFAKITNHQAGFYRHRGCSIG